MHAIRERKFSNFFPEHLHALTGELLVELEYLLHMQDCSFYVRVLQRKLLFIAFSKHSTLLRSPRRYDDV